MTKEQLLAKYDILTGAIPARENETPLQAVERLKASAAELELLKLQSAAALPNNGAAAGTDPAHPSVVMNDDPVDPRPDFDADLGWRTPAVVEWAARRSAAFAAAVRSA